MQKAFADKIDLIDSLSVAPWIDAPKGITVHYTANGSYESLKAEMASIKIGYHFVICKDGTIIQTASLDRTVNHAGKASWHTYSPNRTHVAVAFICWGLLSNEHKTYTKLKINNAVFRRGHFWEPATDEQEASLRVLCKKLIDHYKIDPMHICGHHECALPAGRKVDPSGSLLKTMSEFRDELSNKSLI